MSSVSGKELTKDEKHEEYPWFTYLFECAYDEGIGYEIVGRMAAGESLLSICESDRMPDAAQVCWWMQGTVDSGAAGVLSTQYARARASRADHLAATVDMLITDQASDNPTRKHQNARVAMDGARWYLGRLGSPRWQEPTQQVQHSGNVTLSAVLEQAHDSQQERSLLEQARGRVIEGETVDKSVDK